MSIFATILALAISAVLDLPVTVHLVTGPSSHVELKNTGAQPVTAWQFAVSTKNKDGGFHREFHDADVYLAKVTKDLPGAPGHLNWLMPGESREIPVDPTPEGATTEVVALVFADGTTFGDPKILKTFFDKRAAERDALGHVVTTFNEVIAAKKGMAALDELKQRFDAPSADAASTPMRTARDAVSAFLQQAKAGTPGAEDQADHALRTYAAFVEKQHTLAVEHATPKT